MQTLKGQLLQDNRTLSTKGLQEKKSLFKKSKANSKKSEKILQKKFEKV
jgi:hypothetical protein